MTHPHSYHRVNLRNLTLAKVRHKRPHSAGFQTPNVQHRSREAKSGASTGEGGTTRRMTVSSDLIRTSHSRVVRIVGYCQCPKCQRLAHSGMVKGKESQWRLEVTHQRGLQRLTGPFLWALVGGVPWLRFLSASPSAPCTGLGLHGKVALWVHLSHKVGAPRTGTSSTLSSQDWHVTGTQ